MSEPFLAEIIMFGGNFAPRGWAFCDGQLLPISQFSAVFSLLGTTYGGDGRTTFGLPDLRGRYAMHPGDGPGLSSFRLGQKGGQEQVTLTTNTLPSHNHTATVTIKGNAEDADSTAPGGATWGITPAATYNVETPDTDMHAGIGSATINNTGGSQPFDIHNPYLCVNFIIALQGTYPSRN